MSIRGVLRRRGVAVVVFAFSVVAFTRPTTAQSVTAAADEHQHEGHTAPQGGQAGHEGHEGHEGQHEHEGHDMSEMAREASGTSWLPDASPMYAIHLQEGPWTVMFHENAFVQYL